MIDACSQITKEEVEAALGRTVMEPTRGEELVSRREGTLNSSCMFGSDEGFASLDIKQQSPTSTIAWNATRSYRELKDLIKGGAGQSSVRLEEVNGLGADAFAQIREEAGNHETTELRVLIKRAILTIRVNALASTSTLEVAKTLAGKVISRLGMSDSDILVATPDTSATEPQSEAKSDKDERLKSSKDSQTERASAKKVERSSAKKDTKATSARNSKSVSRRATEPSSKVSRNSTRRTTDRVKKEPPKTTKTRRRS